jgi:uncharacterized RDD family membrane protein YckC
MAGRTLAPRLTLSAVDDHGVESLLQPARLGGRALAYVLDSIVLLAFVLVFVTVGLFYVFLRSDFGDRNPSDPTIWTALAVFMATLPAWLLFNLWLDTTRGQSVGQYVLGLQVLRDDGRTPGLPRHLLRWLALHPLLYHPFLAFFWGLLAFMAVSLAESAPLLVVAGGFLALSVVAPLVSLLSALGDQARRGLHDRVAGTLVVRLE